MGSDADVVASQLKRAQLLLQMNRPREAGEIAARAAARAPHDAAAWTLVARCYARCDEPRRALDAARRAISLAPDTSAPYVIAAEMLNVLGDAAESAQAARRATQIDPFNPHAHARLAIALAQLGGRPELFGLFRPRHLRAAHVHAKRAIELSPTGSTGYFAAAYVAARSDRPRQARKLYRRVLAVDPHHSAAINNLAVIDMKRGRLFRSSTGFRRALATDPSMMLARRNMVILLTTIASAFHFAGWLIYSCFSGIADERGSFSLAWKARCTVALWLGVGYVAVAALVYLGLDRQVRAFSRQVVKQVWFIKLILAFDLMTLGCFVLALLGNGDVASAAYQLGFLGILLSLATLALCAKALRQPSKAR